MDIQTDHSRSATVVTLSGDLDSRTAPVVQDAVLPLVTDGSRLIIDLSAVPYMSSAGLRTLLLVYRQAQQQRSAIVLVGLAADVRDVLDSTGFLSSFMVCDSMEEADRALARVGLSQDGAA
jgi:anti-sigma B factor antagonist